MLDHFGVQQALLHGDQLLDGLACTFGVDEEIIHFDRLRDRLLQLALPLGYHLVRRQANFGGFSSIAFERDGVFVGLRDFLLFALLRFCLLCLRLWKRDRQWRRLRQSDRRATSLYRAVHQRKGVVHDLLRVVCVKGEHAVLHRRVEKLRLAAIELRIQPSLVAGTHARPRVVNATHCANRRAQTATHDAHPRTPTRLSLYGHLTRIR
mmetsp:Transcript_52109/g.144354  ORF Transcript_52109/g.144354 Transcript_52109/m.144354 type:complete len:208 (-) Transcript_52109:1600-2223(-)